MVRSSHPTPRCLATVDTCLSARIVGPFAHGRKTLASLFLVARAPTRAATRDFERWNQVACEGLRC